MTHTFF